MCRAARGDRRPWPSRIAARSAGTSRTRRLPRTRPRRCWCTTPSSSCVSPRGARRVRYDRFHTGYKQMDLAPDELIGAYGCRADGAAGSRSTAKWARAARRRSRSSALPARWTCASGVVRDVRIAFGSVAPTVVRCRAAEQAIRGERLGERGRARCGRGPAQRHRADRRSPLDRALPHARGAEPAATHVRGTLFDLATAYREPTDTSPDSRDLRPMTRQMSRVTKTRRRVARILTPEQYHVLREHGTERAGTCALLHEHRPGTFKCAGCGDAVVSRRAQVRERHRVAELLRTAGGRDRDVRWTAATS